MTITDTAIIGGERYFVIEDRVVDIDEPEESYSHIFHYRKSETGDVLKYTPLLNIGQLYYTFQRDSLHKPYFYYSEFILSKTWRITFVDTNVVARIPSGIFLNCYLYYFGDWKEGRVGFTLIRYLAPSIGVVLETVEGDTHLLIGAYVNGRLIGDTTVTSIAERSFADLPRHPILLLGYSNPFSTKTNIAFAIPEFWPKVVQISIFDISGREVIAFPNQEVRPGSNAILWEGINAQGKQVSSGIYFVRLISGPFSQSMKIHYLKQGG